MSDISFQNKTCSCCTFILSYRNTIRHARSPHASTTMRAQLYVVLKYLSEVSLMAVLEEGIAL